MNGVAIATFVAVSAVLLDVVLYAWHGFYLIALGAFVAAALVYIYVPTD